MKLLNDNINNNNSSEKMQWTKSGLGMHNNELYFCSLSAVTVTEQGSGGGDLTSPFYYEDYFSGEGAPALTLEESETALSDATPKLVTPKLAEKAPQESLNTTTASLPLVRRKRQQNLESEAAELRPVSAEYERQVEPQQARLSDTSETSSKAR